MTAARGVSPGRTALLFGGQGEEQRELGSGSATPARPSPLLERAGKRLGIDLVRALAAGAPELLHTEVAQPVLVALSLETLRDLEQQGFVAAALAGHSLGEVAAFSAAGCFDAEEAVDLACARGAAMARAASAGPGGMVALSANDATEVDALVAAGRRHGPLDVAARNSPTEWTLSGARSALAALAAAGRKTVRLSVSGPWHSSLMDAARLEWTSDLARAVVRSPKTLLIANRTGRAVSAEDDPRELLAGQLTRPVLWMQAMGTLEALDISEVVLVGSVRTLRGLSRANLGPRWKIRSAGDWLRAFAAAT